MAVEIQVGDRMMIQIWIDGESGCNDFHHLFIKDGVTTLNEDDYLHELWVNYCEEHEDDKNG